MLGKRLIKTAIIFMTVSSLTGCGGKKKQIQPWEGKTLPTQEWKEGVAYGNDEDVLDIYEEAESYDIKMGLFDSGEKKEYCQVRLPGDYNIEVVFEDENLQKLNGLFKGKEESAMQLMNGSHSLSDVMKEYDINDLSAPVSRITATSPDGETKVAFCFVGYPFEYYTNTLIDTLNVGTEDYPAVGFKGNEDNLVYVECQISDMYTLTMLYQGELARSGDEYKVAKALYSLVSPLQSSKKSTD